MQKMFHKNKKVAKPTHTSCKSMPPTSNRPRLLRSQLQQLGPIMAQLVLPGTKARALMAWELEGLATLANAASSLFCVFLFLQLIS